MAAGISLRKENSFEDRICFKKQNFSLTLLKECEILGVEVKNMKKKLETAAGRRRVFYYFRRGKVGRNYLEAMEARLEMVRKAHSPEEFQDLMKKVLRSLKGG